MRHARGEKRGVKRDRSMSSSVGSSTTSPLAKAGKIKDRSRVRKHFKLHRKVFKKCEHNRPVSSAQSTTLGLKSKRSSQMCSTGPSKRSSGSGTMLESESWSTELWRVGTMLSVILAENKITLDQAMHAVDKFKDDHDIRILWLKMSLENKIKYVAKTTSVVEEKVKKARKLKKKYMTNVAKSNKGKAVESSNPHDLKVSNSNAKSGNSVATIGVVPLPASDNENVGCVVKGGGGRSAKKQKILEVSHAMEVDEVKKEKVRKVEGEGSGGEKGFAELYPHLMKSFEGEFVPKVPVLDWFKSCLGPLGPLCMVDGAVLEEWNSKWKDIRVAEMDLYLRRIALIQEQANWFANAMKFECPGSDIDIEPI